MRHNGAALNMEAEVREYHFAILGGPSNCASRRGW
jgi:hypothetical protein